jgi:hypothetical protein
MRKRESTELRRRLKKLSGKRSTSVREGPVKRGEALDLPQGAVLDTDYGPTYRIEKTFEADLEHGTRKLSDYLIFSGGLAAEVARQPHFSEVPLERVAFLDTETTGLAGGAGTLVFLVGIGTFESDSFRLRQYFLRDPAEEAGMLHILQEDLDDAAGLVTFNGRAFDLPLLEGRYTVALRRRISLLENPHLDLLHPSRRLWRSTLPDCTLGTIEREVLGVHRTEEDVPGSWIPGLYLDYLRSGDFSEMSRVLYHNTVDILSLVGITSHVLERFQQENMQELSEGEALALARWHQEAGRSDPAESAFRQAITAEDITLRREALRRFTAHLKREGRKMEAVEGWKLWHQLAPDDPQPCIELAKYFEWDLKDYPTALLWAEEGLTCLSHWSAGWRRDRAWSEIEHRIKRLAEKVSST